MDVTFSGVVQCCRSRIVLHRDMCAGCRMSSCRGQGNGVVADICPCRGQLGQVGQARQ